MALLSSVPSYMRICTPSHRALAPSLQAKQLRGELEAAQAATGAAAALAAEWRQRAEQYDRDRQAAAANTRWVDGWVGSWNLCMAGLLLQQATGVWLWGKVLGQLDVLPAARAAADGTLTGCMHAAAMCPPVCLPCLPACLPCLPACLQQG